MAYSEAQKSATYRYRERNPDCTKNRMTVMMPPDDKAVLQAVAERTGESRSEIVRRLVREEAARHGIGPRTCPAGGLTVEEGD